MSTIKHEKEKRKRKNKTDDLSKLHENQLILPAKRQG